MINITTPEDINFHVPYKPGVRDPISAGTHFVGFCAATAAMPFLLAHTVRNSEGSTPLCLISLVIFAISMILLYGASTAYHTFDIGEKGNKRLKKADHMMIFILIAGSYTPMCTIVLGNHTGNVLLICIWAIAAAGILFKALWVTCPRWVSSVIYITMGWAAVFAMGPLHAAMPAGAFILLVTGGVIYTIGGVIYALKLPLLSKLLPGFGAHELFHLFVMGGSLCHYIMMYRFVALM